MVAGKDVTADCNKTDRYGRQACKAWVQPSDRPTCPKTLDAGLAQITVGLAWYYKAYEREQSEEDRHRYADAENEARARRTSLWQDKNPMPPREWRQRQM